MNNREMIRWLLPDARNPPGEKEKRKHQRRADDRHWRVPSRRGRGRRLQRRTDRNFTHEKYAGHCW